MHVQTGEIVNVDKETFDQFRYDPIDGEMSNTQRKMLMKKGLVELSDEEAIELSTLSNKKRKGWMRNQPCVCGSDKKFKKCCWSKFA